MTFSSFRVKFNFSEASIFTQFPANKLESGNEEEEK
jgi:hypothetical protein